MEINTHISNKRVTAYLIGMILFVIMLSIFIFSKQSLRLDESQSLWQSSHTFFGMLNVIGKDVHVPLYEVILHFWQILFGNEVVFGRALSMIFFIASIPLLYYLGKISYNRVIALWATLLFAVSPFMNWYGNEMRMYSLFVLLSILSQIFFVKIFKEQSKNAWIGYAITALLGLYTHYYFSLIFLAQAAFYLLNRKEFPQGSFKRFVMIAGGLFLALSPWLLYVYHLGQVGNSTPLLSAPSTINLFGTFSQFLFGFQNDHLNTILVSLWPITIILAFLALRKNNRLNRETIYFVIAVIVPIVISFSVSITVRPVYLTRYLIFTLPPLYLFLSWLLFSYNKALSLVLRSILLIIMVFTLGIEIINANAPIKEDYKAASSYLEAHASAQDIVVVSAPFTLYPIQYYYKGSAALSSLPIWDQSEQGPVPPFDPETFPDEVKLLTDNHENLWLLLSFDQGYLSDIKLYFDTHYQLIDQQHFSYDLDLYEYKVRY